MRVLAGDVGGTNARFAMVEADERTVGQVTCRAKYRSAEFDGAEAALHCYLEESCGPPDVISLALACPVRDGACTLPNLGWSVDERRLRGSLGTGAPPLAVLNDLAAVAHAIPLLSGADVVELQAGRRRPAGVIAVIGAGTGLGEAYLVPEADGRPQVCPTEGGHADFAPRTELEWRLTGYLERIHGRVSNERVISGPGLEAIYDFLVAEGEPPDPRADEPFADGTHDALDEDDVRAATIAQRGMSGADATCAHALDVFVSAYGARAGNLALTTGATGGVYVAGGIAPKILPRLRRGDFLEAFRDKGRLSEYVEAVPVRVITNTEAGLIGAAAAGVRKARAG